MNRYKDLYSIAKGMTSQGDFLKMCAFGLPILFVIIAIFSGSGSIISVSAVIGIGIGIFIYSYAVSVSAQGQMLLAVADIAVNTSHLLEIRQKIEIMGIEKPGKSSVKTSMEEEKGMPKEKEISEKPPKVFCDDCGQELTEKMNHRCST